MLLEMFASLLAGAPLPLRRRLRGLVIDALGDLLSSSSKDPAGEAQERWVK